MSSIGQIWTSLWLRKHLLESMNMNGKYKVKYFWARNMYSRSNIFLAEMKS